MTTFTTEDRIKAQADQSPTQTRYGALYYETPYHGASIYLSDDGSYVCTHGTTPELLYQDDRNELKK